MCCNSCNLRPPNIAPVVLGFKRLIVHPPRNSTLPKSPLDSPVFLNFDLILTAHAQKLLIPSFKSNSEIATLGPYSATQISHNGRAPIRRSDQMTFVLGVFYYYYYNHCYHNRKQQQLRRRRRRLLLLLLLSCSPKTEHKL